MICRLSSAGGWRDAPQLKRIRLATRRSPSRGAGSSPELVFIDPDEAQHWVEDYYTTIETECVPIGHSVNANIAMVTGFSCHADADEARRRGADGFRFFGFALGYYYMFGKHRPGRSDIWRQFESFKSSMPATNSSGGIGSPDDLRAHLRHFEDVGVDQTIFIQQGGNNQHQHICESLELFAREVMPEFKDRETERQRQKQHRLAPAIAAALARKPRMPPLAGDDIPTFQAYGRSVPEDRKPGSGAGLEVPREAPPES